MAEICIPNVESDRETEIKNALATLSICTKAQIKTETVSMLKINWPDDHPELGAAIRVIVGIAPEKPHIKALGRPRKPYQGDKALGKPYQGNKRLGKLDPMGS